MSLLDLELLAPAGDFSALRAALEAGARAVYFGLKGLNARRRAANFRQAEFAAAVEAVHAHGARAHLTLNIDLAERELGQAARILELARQCGVDAVLVRDPALLALHEQYAQLPLHFSTQTCMANSADVEAAGELGAARVVLAREMTLEEIAAASATPGVQTEVFVQGALCFSVSGRCLLSSWAGGRSGNRGACTSPCRVPWTLEGLPAGTPFSMRDLATIQRLDELRAAGVTALKIEGRLKTADWVGRAVRLYRRALDGTPAAELLPEVEDLGAYTGREMTCGYLDADRHHLTGTAGREPAPVEDSLTPGPSPKGRGEIVEGPSSKGRGEMAEAAAEPERPTYDLEITVGPKAIACRCRCGGQDEQWSIPKTVVRRLHKAVSIGDLLARLEAAPIGDCRLGEATTNDAGFPLVPRAANALVDRVAAVVRRAQKAPDETVRIELPAPVRAILTPEQPAAANRLSLGQPPDRARLEEHAVGPFLRQVRPGSVIVEGLTAGRLGKLRSACRGVSLIVALPAVFFEDDIVPLRKLLRECCRAKVPVEVNSWGGWHLARQAGVVMEGGPGLPVLNSLAARVLARCRLRCVTLSIEADRRQLEDVTAHCPAPCSLVVYGRPPLLTTRVAFSAAEISGKTWEDRRGVRLLARQEGRAWVFRPCEPFDLRNCQNERIRVQHLVADLVGSPDPVGEWYDIPGPKRRTFRFNYDRALA